MSLKLDQIFEFLSEVLEGLSVTLEYFEIDLNTSKKKFLNKFYSLI